MYTETRVYNSPPTMTNEPYFPVLSPDLSGRRASARWFLQRASELQQEGRLQDAVLCYKKSLELHPTAGAGGPLLASYIGRTGLRRHHILRAPLQTRRPGKRPFRLAEHFSEKLYRP